MTKEYRAKTFKSGNSVALRLPKGMGIEPGLEMRVREEAGRFTIEAAEETPRKIRGDWIGSVPGMKVPPRQDFDDRRAWDFSDRADLRK
jgi:antitoxin VapB